MVARLIGLEIKYIISKRYGVTYGDIYSYITHFRTGEYNKKRYDWCSKEVGYILYTVFLM